MLQKATVSFVSANLVWQAPFAGNYNTPTVAWMFQEDSTVFLVVADLLRVRSLVNCQFKITLSVLYHPGSQDTMSNDTYRKFHLAPDIFLSLFSTTYSPKQSPDMWHACHPPSKIFFSVIYALIKQSFEVGIYPVKRLQRSIVTGCTSSPKCRWTTCLMTQRTPLLRYLGVWSQGPSQTLLLTGVQCPGG